MKIQFHFNPKLLRSANISRLQLLSLPSFTTVNIYHFKIYYTDKITTHTHVYTLIKSLTLASISSAFSLASWSIKAIIC